MAFNQIKEYINRDAGTAGTLLIPKLIMPELLDEQGKNLIPRELAAKVWSGFPGSSFDYNMIEEDTLDIDRIAEGAEVPLDAIGYETIEFTPNKYGIAVRITREMMEDSQFSLLSENIKIAGRRFAEKETELILLALDGANATTAGGATLTIANITESMQDLEDSGYNPTDILIGTEVLNDLRNIDTFVEANKAGNTDMLNKGFRGNVYGLNVVLFDDRASPTPGTYKKYAYVLDRSRAYGIALKRDLTMEKVTLPTYDMEGAVLTMRIDVQLLRSKAVSKITTA